MHQCTKRSYNLVTTSCDLKDNLGSLICVSYILLVFSSTKPTIANQSLNMILIPVVGWHINF